MAGFVLVANRSKLSNEHEQLIILGITDRKIMMPAFVCASIGGDALALDTL
jgi:hypothetical protein